MSKLVMIIVVVLFAAAAAAQSNGLAQNDDFQEVSASYLSVRFYFSPGSSCFQLFLQRLRKLLLKWDRVDADKRAQDEAHFRKLSRMDNKLDILISHNENLAAVKDIFLSFVLATLGFVFGAGATKLVLWVVSGFGSLHKLQPLSDAGAGAAPR